MESMLKSIQRPMIVNGKTMTAEEIIEMFGDGKEVTIKLEASAHAQTAQPTRQGDGVFVIGGKYRVKVRQYMTKPSTPEFDFQDKWNKGIPMPFRIMTGTVVKETKGMVQMACHAEPMESSICMVCGRRLTHPVSRLYGIGPECGGHAHINPYNTEEELYAALDEIRSKLNNITWTGWIIKSAIEEMEEV